MSHSLAKCANATVHVWNARAQKVGQLVLLMKVQVAEGTVGEGGEKQRVWNGGGKDERRPLGRDRPMF